MRTWTKSKVTTKKRIMQNNKKSCGELCKLCSFTPRGITKRHTCQHTGQTFEINSPINCKTLGVIYRITCNKCPHFVYIGETGRPLKQRFSEHYRDASQKDETKPCGKHFGLPGHSEANMSAIAMSKYYQKMTLYFVKEEKTSGSIHTNQSILVPTQDHNVLIATLIFSHKHSIITNPPIIPC